MLVRHLSLGDRDCRQRHETSLAQRSVGQLRCLVQLSNNAERRAAAQAELDRRSRESR